MTDRVFSFSVKPTEEDKLERVIRLKLLSIETGKSFSAIVLDALKLYEEKEQANVR